MHYAGTFDGIESIGCVRFLPCLLVFLYYLIRRGVLLLILRPLFVDDSAAIFFDYVKSLQSSCANGRLSSNNHNCDARHYRWAHVEHMENEGNYKNV